MRPSNWISGVLLGAMTLTATAETARAYDLSGTWEGKWSCSGFDGGRFKIVQKLSPLLISQTGDTLAGDFDGGWVYNGRVIADPNKLEKGELILMYCATDNRPGVGDEAEIIRAKVKTKLGADKASFSGLSIYEGTFEGFFEVGTCKYSYKRISAATPNPAIAPCP